MLIIELLIYTITIIQLNLKFVLSILSCYCFNLNSIYIYTITCILKYIKETLYYSIYYNKNKSLIDYTNANFAKAINNYCLINK